MADTFYSYDEPEEPEKAMAESMLPDGVKDFVREFSVAVNRGSLYDITRFYSTEWAKLTDRYFQRSPWPTEEEIAPLVGDDRVFLVLYRLLYHRHSMVYLAKHVPPKPHQYEESWETYQEFFAMVLEDADVDEEDGDGEAGGAGGSGGGLGLELPSQWLYETLSEFIYQYQMFRDQRDSPKRLSEEEMKQMEELDEHAWNLVDILTYLSTMVRESRVEEHLRETRTMPTGLLPQLGYFSLVSLCRVYAQLGDYSSALRTVAVLPLANEAVFSRAASCHITLYYYMGFAMVMSRRYLDALGTFSRALLYYARTKHLHEKDHVMRKKSDQMLAMLAACVVLCPGHKADDSVHDMLTKNYAEAMGRMVQGDARGDQLTAFQDVFSYACPTFLNPVVLSRAEGAPSAADVTKVQLNMFLREVKQRIDVLPQVRSYMRLYTNIAASKLAAFSGVSADETHAQLACVKIKMFQRLSTNEAPVEGDWGSSDSLHFYVDGDVAVVEEVETTDTSAGFYADSIAKFDGLVSQVNRTTVRRAGERKRDGGGRRRDRDGHGDRRRDRGKRDSRRAPPPPVPARFARP